MDAADLLARLSASATGTLTIDFARLDAVLAGDFLRPYVGGSGLLDLDQPAAPQLQGDGVVVRGRGARGPLVGLDVELQFQRSIGSTGAWAVVLTATSHQRWSVVSAFPSIASTPFASLAFVPAPGEPAVVLCVRSERSGEQPRGASLTGRAEAGALGLPGWLTAAADTLAIAGTLEARTIDDPLFYPRGTPRSGPAVTPIGFALRFEVPPAALASSPLRFEKLEGVLRADLRYDSVYYAWRVDPSLRVSADLVLGTGAPVVLPVMARLQGWPPTAASFRTGGEQSQPTTLRALTSVLGELPTPVDGLGLDDLVQLTGLAADVSWEDGAIALDRVSLRVSTADALSWTLLPGVATLDGIDVIFRVSDPFATSRQLQVSVDGLVGIGEEGALALSATFDHAEDEGWSPTFHGALTRDSSVSLTEIFAHVAGVERTDLPQLDVESMSFEVAPSLRRYEGAVEVAGQWPIGGDVPVIIEGVGMSFSQEGDADPTVEIHGGLSLAGAWVAVSAAHQSERAGWLLAGSAGHIPAGRLIDALGGQLGVTLPALVRGLELASLGVTLDTATRHFTFRGTLAFPVESAAPGSTPPRLAVDVTIEPPLQPGGVARTTFGGMLSLGARDIALRYDQQAGLDELWVGSLGHRGTDRIPVADLLDALSPGTAALIPAGLEVQVERAQLALSRADGGARRFLFGVELGAGIALSELPLVGPAFSATQRLGIRLQLVVADADFTAAEIDRINAASPATTTKLRSEALDTAGGRVRLQTTLDLGGRQLPLRAPLVLAGPLTPAAVPLAASPADARLLQWVPVQQAFGALYFERIGVGLTADHQGLALVLDASLTLGGLTLSLLGLGAEISIEALSKGDLVPKPHLDGVGLAFESAGLTLAGALIASGADRAVFDGAVSVRYGDLGISGVGSYREVEGQPSVFVFAEVDYPLGGPAFFFVDGLTFGFGYNRKLILPELDALARFPLLAPAAPASGLAALAGQLSPYLQPAEGEYFVAAGVKFRSFGMVKGRLLVSLAFGRTRELDVLGLATASSPPESEARGAPLLMKAELGIRGRYRPDEGDVFVEGKLQPDAYLFGPGAHLSGGFAFYAWSEQGDFVLTLGGYHPRFAVPAHYPRVPRLALSWQVDEHLSLKAETYFALTSSAMMAGGRLRADWESEDLHASFGAGVDCLVTWQPFAYDAEVDVAVAVAYRTTFHTFTADLVARLAVWGPPFSGTAHVKWWIFSFDVEFGEARRAPAAVTWPAFVEAFLPKGEVLTLGVQSGKVTHHDQGPAAALPANARDDLGVINPRELCLVLRSAVPVTRGVVLQQALDDRSASVGVVPMGRSTLDSVLQVTLVRTGDARALGDRFQVTAHDEPLPAALWGRAAPDPLRGAEPVPGRTRFVLRAHEPAVEAPVPIGAESEPAHARVARPTPGAGFRAYEVGAGEDPPDVTAISAARAARRALLQTLIPDLPTGLGGPNLDALRTPPRRVRS